MDRLFAFPAKIIGKLFIIFSIFSFFVFGCFTCNYLHADCFLHKVYLLGHALP